jgi:multisubunit Na+/H+ antiporter MnhF subunit
MREAGQVIRLAPAPLIADRSFVVAFAMLVIVGIQHSLTVLLGADPHIDWLIDRILVWSMLAFLITGIAIRLAMLVGKRRA